MEFAKRTFQVPVLRGRLESLDLEPGFTCIAAFDVLEHLSDPLETARRCGDLLAPDGVLLLQTPWYRGEGADWSMLQEDEHIHLFTEESIRLLLARAGFRGIRLRPSLFPYDMWVVATRGRLHMGTADEVGAVGDWRLPVAFQSLLDLSQQVRGGREDLALAEADRAARLAQVEELTALLHDSEADRAARLVQVEELTRQTKELTRQVQEPETAQLENVRKLTAMLQDSEADWATRLEQVQELSALLRESEADRAARLEQDQELSDLLRESEADRAERFEVIQRLDARIAEIKRTWAWRFYKTLLSSLTGLKPGE